MPGVYVALDPDAKKKELEIIKTLFDFDIEVWKVDIGDNEDVGSMSKEAIPEMPGKCDPYHSQTTIYC